MWGRKDLFVRRRLLVNQFFKGEIDFQDLRKELHPLLVPSRVIGENHEKRQLKKPIQTEAEQKIEVDSTNLTQTFLIEKFE
ncbi:MAG: hypothetical protein Ta2E_09830 [Mycoplasmoidaceae bacterium]|nr:MAG: hypothetical protein Ta2E_09830 [Mycoplasmoidaceae bacterium]